MLGLRRASRASRLSVTITLAALFTGTFVMGSAEMLVMGMLDFLAADLEVPVAAIGALVSANALGIAIGGPLLTFFTARLDRRPVLLAALAVFSGLNLLPALDANLEAFVAARFVIGAAEGLFIAAAITSATSIVRRDRAGWAMAVVISGFAISGAVGVPLGRLLAEAVGWRGSFFAVAIGASIVLLVALFVLASVPTKGDAGTLGQLRFAFAPRVPAVLTIGLLLFAAVSAALTYLVPFLNGVAGISGDWIWACLMGFGVAAAFGSFGGGKFASAAAAGALFIGTIGVTASLIAMLLWGASALVTVVALLGLGLCSAGITTPWQYRVEHLAGPGAVLVASLPASASNLGDAIGAFAGGQAIITGDIPAVLLVAATLAAAAIVVAFLSRTLDAASRTTSSSTSKPSAAAA